MLLLLTYSLRKRRKALRFMGSIPFWFRVHMVLGIFGPVLIILHANFKFGSLNSSVAFVATLTVACSGLVGRFLYAKVHMGLYGRKAEANQILMQIDALRESLGDEMEAAKYVANELKVLGPRLIPNSPTGMLESLWRSARLSVQTRLELARLLKEAKRLIRKEAKIRRWSFFQRHRRLILIKETLNAYFATVLKAAQLAFFERMFALWHIFHLPLFIIMIMAAILHIWAVHHF